MTDVSTDRATKLRNMLGEHFKARGIDADVGYSEPDSAIRVVIGSLEVPMVDCDELMRNTVAVWMGDAPEATSILKKKGRTISWNDR
ncbi:MAG: hypothetical protein ABWX90_01415 [Candidatus Saccharimonadales bacterium]